MDHEVSPDDCDSGQSSGVTFFSLTSFNQGGTTLFAPSAPFPSHERRSLVLGRRPATTPTRASASTSCSTPRVSSTDRRSSPGPAELNNNCHELTGTTVSESFNASGDLVLRLCASVSGTRIQVE